MNITLPNILSEQNFPKINKGDILITENPSEHEGSYYWSDTQCITIDRLRRRGLQVLIDRETGGLQILAPWPPETSDLDEGDPPAAPHQITIEEYLKDKEKTNGSGDKEKRPLKVKLQTDNNSTSGS